MLTIAHAPQTAAGMTGETDRLNRSPLQRVADGDGDAISICIDAYGSIVWSLARRMTSSNEEAEDAVQEIFIDLWKSAHRFDPEQGSEVTFVAMIARRRLIDRNRSRTRREAMHERARRLDVEHAAPLPDEPLEQDDEIIRARSAFNQLSEAQRRVLHLAIHGGLTHEEIADVTEMPLGTVKTHARRGLIRIRELLSGSSAGTPAMEHDS